MQGLMEKNPRDELERAKGFEPPAHLDSSHEKPRISSKTAFFQIVVESFL
jgi:hypothetical protein